MSAMTRSVSSPYFHSTVTCEVLDELTDVTDLTPSTASTAVSMGLETSDSTLVGLAPG